MAERDEKHLGLGIARQIAIVAVVAVAALAAGLLVGDKFKSPPQLKNLESATVLGEHAKPLPEFALSDHAGKPFNTSRLRGQWSVLFFGYTHCPDICPITLSTMKEVLDTLTPKLPNLDLNVVFISVDPARDTLEHLGQYVTYFDKRFIGVTGSETELNKLAQGLGVVYISPKAPTTSDYLVDHSAQLLLVDPDGALHAVLSAPHQAPLISRNLEAILSSAKG
jgi:protein SCO1/2